MEETDWCVLMEFFIILSEMIYYISNIEIFRNKSQYITQCRSISDII